MMLARSVTGILTAVAALTSFAQTSAQTFPQKPLRIVTGAAGGGNDTTARLVGQMLTESMGQNVVIENRPGIGIIPAQTVAEAPPDGYTLIVYANTVWLLPFLKERVPYDPIKDLAPVSLIAVLPQLLVVNNGLPVNSVRDLIALAKAEPGTLNFSTSGVASVNHLAGELFKSMAGVNIVHVPYKGTALGTTDLIGGRVQLSFPTAASVIQHVKAGRLKALGITTAKPSSLFTDIPTIAASGLPGYDASAMLAMLAPAGTPPAIVKRLHAEVVKSFGRQNTRESFMKAGMEPVGSSPEQLGTAMKSDMARMGKVITDAGIRAE